VTNITYNHGNPFPRFITDPKTVKILKKLGSNAWGDYYPIYNTMDNICAFGIPEADHRTYNDGFWQNKDKAKYLWYD